MNQQHYILTPLQNAKLSENPIPHEWDSRIFSDYCKTPYICLYATCFPCCALASAKTVFDNTDWFFNCCCFSLNCGLVRNYIRQGYRINGKVGTSDCCITCCCSPCVLTQLLNEVTARGPIKHFSNRNLNIIHSTTNSKSNTHETPWITEQLTSSEEENVNQNMFGDSDLCDLCCTFITSQCEILSLFTDFAGVPFWFSLCSTPLCPCCCVNYCQVHHLIRKSYGIGQFCDYYCYWSPFFPTFFIFFLPHFLFSLSYYLFSLKLILYYTNLLYLYALH